LPGVLTKEVMDRRQLLFGAAALGLVANLDFNDLLIAQVGTTTMSSRLSDRARAGLRGPVKTCGYFNGDEAESMSNAEYAADGRLLFWQGRTFDGRVEQVLSYDGTGRLIGITGDGNATDEFHYDEQGKKTRLRTVSPRPDRGSFATGVEIMLETTEEGEGLTGGGSVTTRYNDDDQPIESLVRDAHGELLTKIVHNYADGRLISESLVQQSPELPDEFLNQLPEKQQRSARSQMKELMSQRGLDHIERSYSYDGEGRVVKLVLRMGNIHLETTTTYNEHGDQAGTVRIQSGSLNPSPDDPKLPPERSEVRYLYQYDSHGNWTEKTVDGSSSATHRKLTYY
jgi:YD repeat-containing protein